MSLIKVTAHSMSTKIVVFLIFIVSNSIFAQEITGKWYGLLEVPGSKIRMVLTLTKNELGYAATMESPDQGASIIPVDSTYFENSNLTLVIPAASIEYTGKLDTENNFIGDFKQAGHSFPLNFSRTKFDEAVIAKPQDPVKPYPYLTEDVVFNNKTAGINLAGTLSLPHTKGVFPVVILISGSGPQDRNSEIMGHRPFLVLADHLTKKGIAVLRFDDRGTNKSEGSFATATSNDFATDVEAALAYLKSRPEIDSLKIGLIGHSEGGVIAPIVASNNDDVNFIVLLAGPGLRGDKLMLLQKEIIEREMGMDEVMIAHGQKTFNIVYDLILNSTLNNENLSEAVKSRLAEQYNGAMPEDQLNNITAQLTSPWMINFLRHDPAPVLTSVKCPVLALNGTKDLQVPASQNLEIIASILKKGGNKNVTIMEMENQNHLFQECQTGLPDEYAELEQTIAPVTLTAISDWIIKQLK